MCRHIHEKHNCAQCLPAVETANQHRESEKHTAYYEIPCPGKINNPSLLEPLTLLSTLEIVTLTSVL
jgi:hypothetical protein